MIKKLKFLFTSPDPSSSRSKILAAFDNYVEDNNLLYTRDSIRTIVLGKKVHNLRLRKLPCSFFLFPINDSLEDGFNIRRNIFHNNLIILSDAIFIFKEELSEITTCEVSCEWRKKCLTFLFCGYFDSILLYKKPELKILLPFRNISKLTKFSSSLSTAKVPYIYIHPLPLQLFLNEEAIILENTFEEYKTQMEIV
eukprot:snap_masked-scaffold_22-processed-gene-0.35-mRNA-1 protein AED:1.00 eAED:1.00 QI:0/0/0/0/1/1/2/0/195